MLESHQEKMNALAKHQLVLKQNFKKLEEFVKSAIDQDEQSSEQLKEQVHSLTQCIEKRFQSYNAGCSSHRTTLEDLSLELDSLATKKAAQAEMIALIQAELEHLAREKDSIKVPDASIQESKVRRLKAENEMFKQHFGVEINKVKGGFLQIVFTQISHKRPDAIFMFSVKLDENRKYIVTDCQPPIADVNNIVDEVNSSNDFNKFMRTMRHRFKQMAQVES